LAIVSLLAIQTELAAAQLTILPVRGFPWTRPLYRLCWRNRLHDPAAVAFFALFGRIPITCQVGVATAGSRQADAKKEDVMLQV
jgi:hypothetical protein